MRGICAPEPLQVSIDGAIALVARDQHGVFSRNQATERGASRWLISRRVATGAWERIHASVFALAGSPHTSRQLLMAACLAWGPGAVASHWSSAVLFGFPSFGPGPIEIMVPRGRSRVTEGIVVHRGTMESVDVTTRHNIPTMTPARALIAIASTTEIEILEECIDFGVHRGLFSAPYLRWRVTALAQQGRAGVPRLRDLLDRREPGAVPMNAFERRLFRVLKHYGLPLPEPQYRIHDKGKHVARLDFAYPDRRVAIEAVGAQAHAGPFQWRNDLKRLEQIAAQRWRVIHVTWNDLVDDPEGVAARVAAMLLTP